MKKEILRSITIPEGFSATLDEEILTMKGNGKEIKKKFEIFNYSIKIKDKEISLHSPKATRRESKIMGTVEAHIRNMIKGLEEDFVYKLEICNVHFPMNVKLEGEKVVIKSFLGETTTRIAKILPNVKVDIKGTNITISSNEIEAAGQTAANLEKATRLTGRDRRIFQDGIFITEKNGRSI
jgi:large subunit ribosomal protein L6